MPFLRKSLAAVACLVLCAAPVLAKPGGSSGGGFSGGSRPSSGGSLGGSKPSSSGFSGGSKPSSGSSGKSSSGFSGGSSSSKPSGSTAASGSGFSGGSSKPPIKSTTPIEGKTPTSVSKKPAASDFNKLAVEDSKKAESRRNYEQSHEPAPTYKTPAGHEKKIDPKDKEVSYLRGRLDGERWANRQSRVDGFYGSYASRPMIFYSDPYHPMWNYWLMSQTMDVISMWTYHHMLTMDAARLNSLYAQNAGLRERVAALEAQRLARDPTYMPPGVDHDLAYNDGYVNATYNPKAKDIDEYEYEDEGGGSHWTSSVWAWVCLWVPLIIIVVVLVILFVVYVPVE